MKDSYRRKAAGFTLIEMLVTLVILGIVASIAISSYRDSVRKTRRTDATVALTELANRLEKFYGTCRTYTTNLTNPMPGSCAVPANIGLAYRTTSPDGHYTLSVTDADPADGAAEDIAFGYQIMATPVVGGAQDGDGFFLIDSTNIKQFDANHNGSIDANENRWP